VDTRRPYARARLQAVHFGVQQSRTELICIVAIAAKKRKPILISQYLESDNRKQNRLEKNTENRHQIEKLTLTHDYNRSVITCFNLQATADSTTYQTVTHQSIHCYIFLGSFIIELENCVPQNFLEYDYFYYFINYNRFVLIQSTVRCCYFQHKVTINMF